MIRFTPIVYRTFGFGDKWIDEGSNWKGGGGRTNGMIGQMSAFVVPEVNKGTMGGGEVTTIMTAMPSPSLFPQPFVKPVLLHLSSSLLN